MSEMILPQALEWRTDAPPHDESKALLFCFGNGEYDVLTWNEGCKTFCTGGWGPDRYSDGDITGVPWAALSQKGE